MNALMPFDRLKATPFAFETHAIRVVMRDGEPWFVAADVCGALDLDNTTKALLRLDEDEKSQVIDSSTLNSSEGNGINHLLNVINESGLYSLILGSRKPEAKRFKKWITAEVLPAIRKTGRYELKPTEWTREQILVMALESERERERLAKEVETARPMVEFHEEVKQAEGEFTVDEAAALLFNGAVSGQQLRAWLKQQGWLDSRPRINRPTPWAIHRGYLRLRLDVVHRRLFQVPVLTGNGIELLRHLMRTGELFTARIPRLYLMQEARG